jgi:hypothetical protein
LRGASNRAASRSKKRHASSSVSSSDTIVSALLRASFGEIAAANASALSAIACRASRNTRSLAFTDQSAHAPRAGFIAIAAASWQIPAQVDVAG